MASFALFTALAVVLTLNWATVPGLPDLVRAPLVVVGVTFAICSALMTLVAATTDYR